MRKRKGTVIETIVVILILVFLLACINPVLKHLRKKSGRVLCSTNLKGLGTGMAVYANDYDGEYPKLGFGPWSKKLGYRFDDKSFPTARYKGPCTITSSLYMLVREADVSPGSFICTETRPDYRIVKPRKYSRFEGENNNNLDMVELWDFGPDPYKHVSYAYHNPYGKFPADHGRPAAFAVAADMSPWFSNGDIQPPQIGESAPQIIQLTDPATWKYGLSLNHQLKERSYSEGHNILFADGHASHEKQPNVGVNNDNIFTFWSTDKTVTEQDKQGGTAPTSRSAENDAKSRDDSFLVI